MKTFVIGASLAALLAVPALAVQQGATQRPAAAPQTRAQVQAMVEQRFAAIDANRDGAVNQAEFDAHRQKKQADRQASRARRKAEHFARLDGNKDGQISRAEFDGGQGQRGDRVGERRGHGGHHKGMRGRGGMGMGGNWFASLDANKDGRVTLAEAVAKPLQRFDQVDANKDGTVTPEERRAARAARRG